MNASSESGLCAILISRTPVEESTALPVSGLGDDEVPVTLWESFLLRGIRIAPHPLLSKIDQQAYARDCRSRIFSHPVAIAAAAITLSVSPGKKGRIAAFSVILSETWVKSASHRAPLSKIKALPIAAERTLVGNPGFSVRASQETAMA